MKLNVPDGTIITATENTPIKADEGTFHAWDVYVFIDGEKVERCESCKVGKDGYAVIVGKTFNKETGEFNKIVKRGCAHLELIK